MTAILTSQSDFLLGAELLDRGKDNHCGCATEEWLVGMTHLMVHYEDGRADCYQDTGEYWEESISIEEPDMVKARSLAIFWAWDMLVDHNWTQPIPEAPDMRNAA